MDPVTEQIVLPAEYGSPNVLLQWAPIRARLEAAERYWVATTRHDGRPHAVPVDGIWLDELFYFGGSPQTIHQRNISTNPEVVMHLEDALAAVIVEGTVEQVTPSMEVAKRLAEASQVKYGYGPSPESYTTGVPALRPRLVLAWNELPKDATRFRFAQREPVTSRS